MILDYNIMDDEDMGTDEGVVTPAGDDDEEVEGDDMDTTSEESTEEAM